MGADAALTDAPPTAVAPQVAYFSMEIALDAAMPTYAGGLGVLAGDTLRAAADVGVPLAGITLLHRDGYFRQRLDAEGRQSEEPARWEPADFLEPLSARATVRIEGREVRVGCWRYRVRGSSGHEVPVYLLDTDLPENGPADRALTGRLYGGDLRYRLCQEAVLGLGGVAVLRALGHDELATYHMNEGHSALLALALLAERVGEREPATVTPQDEQAVRDRCVFTTHTPVPAGHDQFPGDLARRVLGERIAGLVDACDCALDGVLNMTNLALHFSRYVNGVAMRHGEISRGMFPRYPVNSITNGVHAITWTAPPLRRLFDEYLPEWRRDNLYLRYAISIPVDRIREAHLEAKLALLDEIERRAGVRLDPTALTLGFARRATAYKRADLLFSDPDRLRRIARDAGALQVVLGGKAHPLDEGGKRAIRRIFEAAHDLDGAVPVVYLEEYDVELASMLCAGVDVWLNTPQKPLEASGTSGMKAALNGVPNLSVLDGWWVEGCIEGVTGWAIGDPGPESDPAGEAESLYRQLDDAVLPSYYRDPDGFAAIMRSAIALNGSFFNAERMVRQYMDHAYDLL